MLRRGEGEGFVEIETTDGLTTRREFTAGQPSKLTIKDGRGGVFKRPQELCDSKTNALCFDPLAFTRMSREKLRTAMLDIAEIDFDDVFKADLMTKDDEAIEAAITDRKALWTGAKSGVKGMGHETELGDGEGTEDKTEAEKENAKGKFLKAAGKSANKK